MEVTTKQLRIEPGRIISEVQSGQEITVTYRGKPCAKIIPVNTRKKITLEEPEDELFGIWKDRTDMADVEQYVRNLRRGRKVC
jgi:prevent-host-death family protein